MTSVTTRPEPGRARDYRFPEFTRVTTPNGITLLHVPVHRVPVVTVIALTGGGACVEAPTAIGLATLTAAALQEGSTERTGDELIEAFEELGASGDAAADWDASILKMTVGSPNFGAALALFGETLMRPAFPERGFDRLKAERLAELDQIKAEPRGLADEMFSRFLYSDASRFALPLGGSRESVSRLTAGDSRRHHELHYTAPGTTLIVVGDVEREEALELVSGTFGSWGSDRLQADNGGSHEAQPQRPDDIRSASRTVRLIGKPDAPQSEIRLGHRGIPRQHPDYFPAVVMNALLGGLFSSRINLNLREEHGYTYGASSYFDWRRNAGPFVISCAVETEVTAEAVAEMLREVDRIRHEPVSAEEISLATSYLAGVFPIRYETTASVASALANLTVFGLPDEYFDTYRDSILAVSADDIQSAAQTLLDPDALQLVVVGQADQMEEKIAALDLGPLSIYDPNDLL